MAKASGIYALLLCTRSVKVNPIDKLVTFICVRLYQNIVVYPRDKCHIVMARIRMAQTPRYAGHTDWRLKAVLNSEFSVL